MLSKRGSAVVDARTNTLFVQDTPSRLEEVRKLIAKIDVPVRQVMIEARIVEANDNFNRTWARKLGYNEIWHQRPPASRSPGSRRALRVRQSTLGNVDSTNSVGGAQGIASPDAERRADRRTCRRQA